MAEHEAGPGQRTRRGLVAGVAALVAGALALDGVYIEAFGGAAIWIGGAAGDALTADVVNSILVQSGWGLDVDSSAKVTATLTNCTLDTNTNGVVIVKAATASSGPALETVSEPSR